MGKFKIGDVVKLNSGGPGMTVVEDLHYILPGWVSCKWFTRELGNGAEHGRWRLRVGRFHESTIFPPGSWSN